MDDVLLHCLDCGHQWSISCPVEIDGDGEEVTRIGMFDDLCPKCQSQGEIVDEEPEPARQAR